MKYSEPARNTAFPPNVDAIEDFFDESLQSRIHGNVTLRGKTYPWRQWSGQQCQSKLLAIDTETEVVKTRAHVPQLAVFQAFDGQTSYLVKPEAVGTFLSAHEVANFVVHNVAFDWQVVYAHFRRHRDKASMRRWLRIVDQDRISDTMLLDQLVRIAYGASHPTYRSLGELSRKYCNIELDKNDPYRTRFGETIGTDWTEFPMQAWEYAAKDAIVTRLVFTELRERARRLVRHHKISTSTLGNFGPLTVRVQVKAAIALRQIELNGIHIDEKQCESSLRDLQRQVAIHIETLSSYPEFASVFKVDKSGNLMLTVGGVPRKNMHQLRQMLTEVANKHDIALKLTSTGAVSTAKSFWEEHADVEPFLSAWLELEQTGKLLQFFKQLKAGKIHPGYTALVRTGRTSSQKPNLQQIPAKGTFRHMFVPRPGHVFVIADYETLELRTLAAHCEDVIGFSVMADKIREGVDLHAYTASILTGLELCDFLDLKTTDTDFFKAKRTAAKALNFGFPGGLGPATFVKFAKLSYGLDVSAEEAEEFRHKFLNEIYPELGEYMHADVTTALAANLRCKSWQVQQQFRTEATLGACRRIVQGNPITREGKPYDEKFVDECWKRLTKLNRNGQLQADIERRVAGDQLERRLFFDTVIAPGGFIRGRTTFCQSKNTPFQSAAATGGKIAAWELFRAGYRVCGYIHDEFIVEIPESADYEYEASKIDRIMCDAMEQVTGTVPISTEYAVASCWSKSAELVRDGDGKIRVWTP